MLRLHTYNKSGDHHYQRERENESCKKRVSLSWFDCVIKLLLCTVLYCAVHDFARFVSIVFIGIVCARTESTECVLITHSHKYIPETYGYHGMARCMVVSFRFFIDVVVCSAA